MKFGPIIELLFIRMTQRQVISDYFRFLLKNIYTIIDTRSFPKHIESLPPLQDDEADDLYHAEALFTNIPVLE